MIEKYKSLDNLLQKGDVTLTSSGDASNSKYLLHASVMDYNLGVRYEDKLPTLESIETILHNIDPYLQWHADKQKIESIKLVLPL